MAAVRTQHEGLNVEALDEALQAALGTRFRGLSVAGEWVTAHLHEEATSEQAALALRILREHDPAVLTVRQQAAAEQAARLAVSRAEAGPLFDPVPYAADPALHTLARRIQWLELELRELRGL